MSVSAWSRAVTKMMGVSSERGRCRISCAVSKPSMIGMRTSSSTTANSDSNSWRRAAALAEGEEPAADQAVVDEPVGSLLQRLPEIDEHVRAHDEMEVVERAIGGEVVLGPGDAPRQAAVEASAPAGDRVVVGEAAPAARR